jgi:hypothetical protein
MKLMGNWGMPFTIETALKHRDIEDLMHVEICSSAQKLHSNECMYLLTSYFIDL